MTEGTTVKVPAFFEVERDRFCPVTREMLEMTPNGPRLTINGRTFRLGFRDEGGVRVPVCGGRMIEHPAKDKHG